MPETDEFGLPQSVRVTLVRSPIAQKPKTLGTLRALGLWSVGDTNVLTLNDPLRGMLRKTRHLVTADPFDADPGAVLEKADRELGSAQLVTDFASNSDGVFLSFLAGYTVREADAAIRSAIADFEPTRCLALSWDRSQGRLLSFTGDLSERLYLRPRRHAQRDLLRLALLRIEGDGWLAGLEPPLSFEPRNTEIYLAGSPQARETVASMAEIIGGKRFGRTLGARVRSADTSSDVGGQQRG